MISKHIDIRSVSFSYDLGKNLFIEERCGFNFEDAIKAIESGQLLDLLKHPNEKKYPHQFIFVIKINDYVYAVPSVYDASTKRVFLKTMYPSRKLTKEFI